MYNYDICPAKSRSMCSVVHFGLQNVFTALAHFILMGPNEQPLLSCLSGVGVFCFFSSTFLLCQNSIHKIYHLSFFFKKGFVYLFGGGERVQAGGGVRGEEQGKSSDSPLSTEPHRAPSQDPEIMT